MRSIRRAIKRPLFRLWVIPKRKVVKKVVASAAVALAMITASVEAEPDYSIMAWNNQICVGMPYTLVLEAWGRPATVNVSVWGDSALEYWWYANGALVIIQHKRVVSFTQ